MDSNSLSNTKLTVTHVNLLDNTVEGVECREDRVFSVQYHPESAPGPQDSSYLFDQFCALWRKTKMPKRTDIKKILVIGSGPIVIDRLRNLIMLEHRRAWPFGKRVYGCFGKLQSGYNYDGQRHCG